jgi:hypothetical protein
MANKGMKKKSFSYAQLPKQGDVDVVLAFLFQKILQVHCSNHQRFDYLMLRYLADEKNHFPQNIRDKTSIRGNLRKELLKTTMSWKVFCKGLCFLEIHSININTVLLHPGQKTTSHLSEIIYLNNSKSSNCVLATMYHRILNELGLNSNNLLEFFNKQLVNADPAFRGNLKKELLKPIMTWKVFCKGIWFLNCEKINFYVNIIEPKMPISSHGIVMRSPSFPVLLNLPTGN